MSDIKKTIRDLALYGDVTFIILANSDWYVSFKPRGWGSLWFYDRKPELEDALAGVREKAAQHRIFTSSLA